MSVYKDKWNGYNGETWRVECYFLNWKGERKRHEKRGFKSKKEAVAYEREFIAKSKRDINMSFASFLDIYLGDIRPQLKISTYATKINIVDLHIRPYFENLSLSEITPTEILKWHNELLSKRDEQGKGYSPVYLRTIHNQLNAVFNHAVRYYDLPKNPCYAYKKLGKAKGKEMLFWTKQEYLQFSEAMKIKPASYYAFQILYWTGIREGELLALTRRDFDMDKKQMRINKNFQVINGKEIIQTPKTEKSDRVIDIPQFLCDEIQDYIETLYKVDDSTRIFPFKKSYLHHEMNRGCNATGVKRIRIHDLRHSHCALLINLGYSPIEIAERLGHESVTITERYSHLYPSVQRKMADSLEGAFTNDDATSVEKKNG